MSLGYVKHLPWEVQFHLKQNSDNEYGFQKILDLIIDHKSKTSAQIIDHIYKDVSAYSKQSNQEDDITALICKVKETYHLSH